MKKWIEDRTEIRKLKKWEASWLAAVIDGEGSIGIYNYGREGRRVCIQIGNTDEKFVLRVRELIGAGSSIRRYVFRSSHKGRKPIFYYSLKGSNRCYKVLNQIVPYPIIKRDKAFNIISELEERPFGRWANATSEARARASELAKKRWSDPEFKFRTIQRMREFYEIKENLQRHREGMKAVWQNARS